MNELSNRTRPALSHSRTDWFLLAGFCGFLFFLGLSSFGLLGADEPRYAQVAREMLVRHDWITPTLGGQPWLEKPVLYYWQAMLSYKAFGVSDWAARLPSAVDATVMVLGVFLFLRRFRPGFQLDGALITAAAAGIIGFARAASMDMPLAALFTIGMLAWYAWHESGDKSFLAVFYAVIGLGTLAKGPVAPFLAAAIVIIFALATRKPVTLAKTLWIPGIVVFLCVAAPWYVAVQLRNPEFFRVFILEHNLSRFGTNRYHHLQPVWYYLPVLFIGLLPWTVFTITATFESALAWLRQKTANDEGGFTTFLLIWFLLPVLFFSLSQSKLPGYILPAVPAGCLLVSEHLRRSTQAGKAIRLWLVVSHSVVSALLLLAALLLPLLILKRPLGWNGTTILAFAVSVVLAIAIGATLRLQHGLRLLRFVTLIPVILMIAAVLRLDARFLDERLSTRPLSVALNSIDNQSLPIAVYEVRREVEYGLAFYRNQSIARYESGEIPSGEHLLVVPHAVAMAQGNQKLPGRRISYLGTDQPQGLDYFWVSAPGVSMGHMHGM